MVQGLGAPGLQLRAELTEPAGSVSAPFDRLPANLAEVLASVAGVTEVLHFTYADGRLRVAVTPTADRRPARTAAEAVSGPDLPVEIMLGSTDRAQQHMFERLGALADRLGEIPGVDRVAVAPGAMTLTTGDVAAVGTIHDAATSHQQLTRLTLMIEVSMDGDTRGRYTRPAGAGSERFAIFRTLLGLSALDKAIVVEASGGRPSWVAVHLAGPLTEVSRLKHVLPSGQDVEVTDAHGRSVRFTVAHTLRPKDLTSWRDDVDRRAVVTAWNAA